MRVAVLADIHGNLPALEAVLRDVDAAGADAIVLAGDMTVGPLQAETLDLLNSRGAKVIWVRGNCERAVVEVFDGSYRSTGAAHEPGVIWAGQQLTRAQRDQLASLPMTVSLQVDGLGAVLFCHATARDDEEIVLVEGPQSLHTSAQRLAGFNRAGGGDRVPGGFSYEDGVAAAERLLARGNLPDAIVAANDEAAIGVLMRLRDRGVDVPGQVSVAGIDDTRPAHFVGLTTVSVPLHDMGKRAA